MADDPGQTRCILSLAITVQLAPELVPGPALDESIIHAVRSALLQLNEAGREWTFMDVRRGALTVTRLAETPE